MSFSSLHVHYFCLLNFVAEHHTASASTWPRHAPTLASLCDLKGRFHDNCIIVTMPKKKKEKGGKKKGKGKGEVKEKGEDTDKPFEAPGVSEKEKILKKE